MNTFLAICLYFFAAAAVLGLVPASFFAAKTGIPGAVLAPLLTAAFVVYVLATAGWRLAHG